jgi:hypothetical protein
MPTPFSFNGSLQLPGDAALCATPIPIALAAQFSAEFVGVFPVQGAGTFHVPLGMIGPAGLKGLLIKVDPSTDPTVAPIVVRVNGQPIGEEVSPGGFKALGSPQPVAGITTLSVTHTSSNTVRIWALG